MRIKRLLGIFIIPLMLVSCQQKITFPPVSETPSQIHNPGQFLWHDLATYDPEKAKDFYSEVFGWKFENIGSDKNVYYVIKNNGKAIGGIFKLGDKYGNVAEWISSLSVNDIDDAIKYNTENGGTTIFDKATFSGRGETALISDPQGAFVALLHSETGDPLLSKVIGIQTNEWLWDELWSNDLDRSLTFYTGLVGCETVEVSNVKHPYFVFKRGRNTFSGVIGNPVEGARSSWMPYIKVKDVSETLAKAKAAGAHVMLEPTSSIRKGTVAVLMDPTGGQFTIQQWILK